MNKKIIFIIIGIIVSVVVVSAVSLEKNPKRASLGSAKSHPWYAVHLNNGHVYFGHLLSATSDTIALGNTYYLEVFTAQQEQVATSTNFQVQQTPQQIYNLARRGNGSSMATDNTLFINKSAVLFWEKLSPGSDMAKSLAKTETADK